MCAKECDNRPKLSKCKWGLWGDQGEGNRGFCDIVGTPEGLLLGKGESLTCDLPADFAKLLDILRKESQL